MRRFLTIGLDGQGKITVLAGPEKSYTEHRDGFRKLAADKKKKADDGFAEVQVIDISRGIVKRLRNGKVKLKGGDNDGKRTVSRTVDSKAEKTPRKKDATPRRTAARKKIADSKAASPKTPAASAPAPAADEGAFPDSGPKL